MNPLIPNTGDIPPLPAPPLWERFLLEQPLPLAALLLITGLVAAWIMRNKNRRASLAGLVIGVGSAVGLWLLAGSVQTVREVVSERAEALVEAVATGDEPALQALLFDQVTVSGRPAGTIEGRRNIIAAAQSRVVPLVENARTIEVRAVQDNASTARTQVRVRVRVASGSGFDSNSWWLIVWRLDTSAPTPEWVATSIEPLWVQGVG